MPVAKHMGFPTYTGTVQDNAFLCHPWITDVIFSLIRELPREIKSILYTVFSIFTEDPHSTNFMSSLYIF